MRVFLAAMLAVLGLASGAFAFDYKAIMAEAGRQTVTFGEAFEQGQGGPLLVHFSFDAPQHPNMQFGFQQHPDSPNKLGTLSFGTPEGAMVEDVVIYAHRFGAEVETVTVDNLAAVISGPLAQGVFANREGLELRGLNAATVQGREAAQLIATYDDPNVGKVAVRVVGIVPPSGRNAVIFVARSVVGSLGLESLEDLGRTPAGAMVGTVRLLGTRPDAETLIPF